MIRVAGPLESAATHFAQYGLAAIMQDAGVPGVRLQWHEAAEAFATVSWTGDADPGQLIVEHARAKTHPDSWVQQLRAPAGTATGLFSPRVKQMAEQDLAAWVSWRREELDRSGLTPLDRRMIGALGEPAHWNYGIEDKFNPDRGASRWEMADRRSGREFVKDRISRFARVVSQFTATEATMGVCGSRLKDLDKATDQSQTPTGFTPPRPMDVAFAWCVMWGISATTLIPSAGRTSQTSGMPPNHFIFPANTVLPVSLRPITLARVRNFFRAREFQAAAFSIDPDVRRDAGRVLSTLGLRALIDFPIDVVESSGAIDRVIRFGQVRILEVER